MAAWAETGLALYVSSMMNTGPGRRLSSKRPGDGVNPSSPVAMALSESPRAWAVAGGGQGVGHVVPAQQVEPHVDPPARHLDSEPGAVHSGFGGPGQGNVRLSG